MPTFSFQRLAHGSHYREVEGVVPGVEQTTTDILALAKPTYAGHAKGVFDALYHQGIGIDPETLVRPREEIVINVVMQLQADGAHRFFINEVFECVRAHRLPVQLQNGLQPVDGSLTLLHLATIAQ